MLRISFIFVVLTAAAANSAGADAPKPNILLLYLDNVGYGDLGCYGNMEARTPEIDRLAADGVRFTQWYCGSPSCSPSRGALLTGRHPERNGLNYQLKPDENLRGVGLPQTEKILPQYLSPLGYRCGAFGKWNIGFAPGSRPTERGFHHFFGHASGNIHYYKHLYHGQNDLRRDTQEVDLLDTYSTDLFADAAINFIQDARSLPWFVYLPFNAVHFVSDVNCEPGEKPVWQAPPEAFAKAGYEPNDSDPRHRFLAVLAALDTAVGRVLRTIDEYGLRERTIVLCISDNGAFMLPGRGIDEQSNKPLRDGGVTVYEGGVRVPAIVRWPGAITAGSTCNALLSSLDVVPSLVAAAGGELPADRTFDGRDARSAWKSSAPTPHEALWWMWEKRQAIRVGQWKLLRNGPTEPWALYDLENDVAESRDVAQSQAEVVARLIAEFERLQRAAHDDPTRSRSAREK